MRDVTKKVIEEHWNDFTLVTPKELVEKYPIMKEFVQNINWWGNKMVCLRFKDENNNYGEQGRYRIKLFSDKYVYAIDIAPARNGEGNPYIGCVYDSRKPEPMETWTRGGDLTDGYDGEKTITRIVMEIVERELTGLEVEGYNNKETFSKPWKNEL